MSVQDRQWAGLMKNLGVWQGSLTHYDANAVQQERQPSVVFLEGEGEADDGLPNALNLCLRRLGKESEYRATYNRHKLPDKDRAIVYNEKTGSMCDGGKSAPAPITEQILKFDNGRVRLITQYKEDGEGVRKFALFRERPSSQKSWWSTKDTKVDADVVASDAPWLESSRSSLLSQQGIKDFIGEWSSTSAELINANGVNETLSINEVLELVPKNSSLEDGAKQVELSDSTLLSSFGGGIASRLSQRAPYIEGDTQIEFLRLDGATLHRLSRKFVQGRYSGSEFCTYERNTK